MTTATQRLNGSLDGQLNGCHNRRGFQSWVEVQAGWQESDSVDDSKTRSPVMDIVPFRMAYDCQYTLTELGQQDKGCEGCKWRRAA